MQNRFSSPLPLTFGERNNKKPTCIVRAAVRMAVLLNQKNQTYWLFVKHPAKGLELPGGAVDPHEAAEAAVRRELYEEAGIALPQAHSIQMAGTVPIQDSQGGSWLDIVYYTYISDTIMTSKEVDREFDIVWLTVNAMTDKLSSNAQSIVDCVQNARKESFDRES